ncbi:hypothetical protein LCGC14_0330010 [marine sediment metagenome]|uniref:Uncharacterized protein n=1 Tax=marine sediment metagenome TaxID=412755 RepID=A0A0F9WNZ4_9ZZZZ
MTRKFAALLERVEELERRVSNLEASDEDYMDGYGAVVDVHEPEEYEGFVEDIDEFGYGGWREAGNDDS